MNTPPWENIWICERFEIPLGRFQASFRVIPHGPWSNQVPPTTMIFHHRLCSFNTDRTPISVAQIPLFYSKNHISVVQKQISTTEYYWHYWSNRIFFLLNDVGFQCSREKKAQNPSVFQWWFFRRGWLAGQCSVPEAMQIRGLSGFIQVEVSPCFTRNLDLDIVGLVMW